MAQEQVRPCGDCAACCKALAVMELELVKPEGEWCKHCTTRKRCDIYPVRPESCRDFLCAWAKGSGGEEERPDKVRIVCVTEAVPFRGRTVNWCTMMEVSHGALSSKYAMARTESLRALGWIVEWFTHDMGRQTIILPKGIEKHDLPLVMANLKKAELPSRLFVT